MASNNPTFELGFLDDFEELQNVSEMVAETSEASKDQQSKRATRWKQHVHVHVQNLQIDQCRKSGFLAWKMSCYVIKAMDNV